MGRNKVKEVRQRFRTLHFETFEPLLLLSAAPIGELTEGNASSWSTFASDGQPTSVANDTTHVKVGSNSLRFTTLSGFDTGVKYPSAGTPHWDLTDRNYLTFWVYAVNTTPIGFQGNQPIIVLNGPGGSFRYEPSIQLFANNSWAKIRVPLAGDAQWNRTTSGTPSLADINQLEIHADTWDYGFSLYLDGVAFEYLDPNQLPPPGPPAPPGVNPDAIHPRVLLYVFDPIMENLGGQRLHAAYGWQDPVTLTQQVVSDLTTSSHGLLQYEVVETVIADVHPYFTDGFQHTDSSFVTAWNNHDFHSAAHFDYPRLVSDNGIAARIDSGDLDEVWVYAPPIAGLWESTMAGAGAYWINGPTQNVPTQRAFPIMGWNYERGVGEAIHSYGHRAESTMDHMYGHQQPNLNNNWNKFTFQDRYQPGMGGVGNVHFPVNATSDYDYFNLNWVTSNADDWYNYPNFQGTTRQFSALEWSPQNPRDPQREYLNWWYAHMPHFASRGTDYYLANWWRYLADLDQFKASNGNLYLTSGIPTVQIHAPATAQTSSTVTITADASADGALGRVDFYVDGVYVATDDVGPFRFSWDTTGLLGQHTLVAKAYELQNGTEAISQTAIVDVQPPGTVVGRHLFYNQSGTSTRFDGNNLAINASDDNAIATDKTAYLWEDAGAATFANVSSYTKGINGVMIDIAGPHPNITADDFIFRVGNNNSPGLWGTANAPTSISVRAGAGTGGSDRVEIIWNTGAPIKQWLNVIVLANADTGLAQKVSYPAGHGDQFFFGNAMGNVGTGDTAANSLVTALDEAAIRANNALVSANIPITNIYDVGRNASVSALDESAARLNGTNPTTTLSYLNLTSAPAAPEADSGDDVSPLVASDSWDAGVASGLTAPALPASLDGGVPKWLTNRIDSIDLNTGSPARLFQYLHDANTPRSRALLEKFDDVADALGLDDELLDELLADLK